MGARSTVMKSSRFLKPSGRASCSGRIMRNSRMTPAAAASAMIESRSRVRRAGKTLTRISVAAEPSTAGSTRKGRKAPAATNGNSSPPRYTMP